jgi:hypothetical protein
MNFVSSLTRAIFLLIINPSVWQAKPERPNNIKNIFRDWKKLKKMIIVFYSALPNIYTYVQGLMYERRILKIKKGPVKV